MIDGEVTAGIARGSLASSARWRGVLSLVVLHTLPGAVGSQRPFLSTDHFAARQKNARRHARYVSSSDGQTMLLFDLVTAGARRTSVGAGKTQKDDRRRPVTDGGRPTDDGRRPTTEDRRQSPAATTDDRKACAQALRGALVRGTPPVRAHL